MNMCHNIKNFLFSIFLVLALASPAYSASIIKYGKIWYCDDCQVNWAQFQARYKWFLATDASCNPPSGVSGRYVVDYKIFREIGGWRYNDDHYEAGTQLVALMTWIQSNYASYGYSTWQEGFEDCFVHLKNEDVYKALNNIKESGSTFLLTTTYIHENKNNDTDKGKWRPINLNENPFNLLRYIEYIGTDFRDEGRNYPGNGMAIWRISDLFE